MFGAIELGIMAAAQMAHLDHLCHKEDRKRLMAMSPEERECELELRRISAIQNIEIEPPKFSIF